MDSVSSLSAKVCCRMSLSKDGLVIDRESAEAAGESLLEVRPRYFEGRALDDTPGLLAESYALRYQVYCLERAFLHAENYPDHLEIDAFDSHSLHVGTINLQGHLVGTARLVQAGAGGLPLFHYCMISPNEMELYRPGNTVVEVSRLAVSRNYRRRREDGPYGTRGAAPYNAATERREGVARLGGELVVSLYRTLYQTSKRNGITHWLAAVEKSLLRLLLKCEFPFRAIGPEIDYFGPVAPYLMSLAQFDQAILAHRKPFLDDFLVDLEPEFCPQPVSP
jgi:N-acyl amino acid synthase of PEP-CTERM/exosortase system